MKIVVDKAIPFLEGILEPYAEVTYLPGSAINRECLIDADALITRTRTKCSEALLDGTPVKMIATATIGMDHIDLPFCESRGIYVQNSAGCNAGGVMNYVLSALYGVAARRGIDLKGMTFGIIGVGNVGKRVEDAARYLGFNVLLNDPPRAAAEGSGQFCSLETLLDRSDIVTMHVPLNERTRKMAGKDFFSRMKMESIFINAARGEVVDECALMDAIPKLGPVIIDTWNNEPDVNMELMRQVDIATPHIAGYSYQGKLKGTAMAVRAVARFFDIKDLFEFYPVSTISSLDAVPLDLIGKTQGEIASAIQYNYPIFTDDFIFRTNPSSFEKLRAEYQYRREFYF